MLDELRLHTGGAPLEESGNEVSFRTEDPQRALYELMSWARDNDVELDGLDVRRPSLEDVFLELTSEHEGAPA